MLWAVGQFMWPIQEFRPRRGDALTVYPGWPRQAALHSVDRWVRFWRRCKANEAKAQEQSLMGD